MMLSGLTEIASDAGSLAVAALSVNTTGTLHSANVTSRKLLDGIMAMTF
jgi:tetrahydromethanopterin S-methyltransferase subunit C